MRIEDKKLEIFENDPVSNLLAGMERFEAPGDFDFRVKARIAKGRPADRNTSLLPAWARFAVPLVLVMFAGGYFGLRSLNSPDENVQPAASLAEVQQLGIVPAIDVPVPVIETPGFEPPANKALTAQIDVKSSNTTERPGVVSSNKLVSRTGNADKKPGGGSFDMGQGISRVRVLPKPKDLNKSAGITAKDMLMQLGVDASYLSSSWKVGGVKQNSMADRSGLKAGDVVEAINDQNLTEKTTLASPFSGKSIRVRRDGKSVHIDLKP